MSQVEQRSTLPFSHPLPAKLRPGRKTMTLADGYQTPVYIYVPPKETKLRRPVVYLHGIQSHPGWFGPSAAALAKIGHPVFQPTRRGSGANTVDQGHAVSAGQLLDDIAAACRLAMRAARVDRVHLVGVSWGGKLAAAFALRTPPGIKLASLTMVAPGIVPHVDVSILTKLAISLCVLLWPRKTFSIPLNDVKLFTDNEEMREFLRGDSFRLHRATARLLFASNRLDAILRRAREGALSIPTTLLLGARDRIVDNVHTRKVVIHLTAGRDVIEEFDAAHTLEFEEHTRQFLTALCAAVERGEK